MLNEFKSADLIIDCTDSLGSKKFIFKFCKKHKKTLIYGSVVGTKGYVVTIDFKDTKLNNIIYKTLYDKKPDNTNKSGVYSLAVQGIANLQSTLALKYLLDNKEDINKLYNFDICILI
jgi:adenylyltransferase/sulfurtransferase